MKRDEIRDLFVSLSKSQGYYGRLLENIDNLSPDEQDAFWEEMESHDFTDALDVIMYIEG